MTPRPADTMPGPTETASGARGRINNEPGSPPLHREGSISEKAPREFWDLLHEWADTASEERRDAIEHRFNELFTLAARSLLSQARVGAGGEQAAIPVLNALEVLDTLRLPNTHRTAADLLQRMGEAGLFVIRNPLAASPKEQPVQPTPLPIVCDNCDEMGDCTGHPHCAAATQPTDAGRRQ